MKLAAVSAAALACLVFQPQSASAQAELLMMRMCKRFADDAQRLKCFDAISEELPAKAEAEPKPQPRWSVTDSKSPIDDSAQVSAMLPSLDRKAALVIRCQERKTEAAVLFDDLFVFKQATVLLRLNDLPAASGIWSGADNNKAVFAPNGVAFTKMLPNDGTLFIRATGHSRQADATFRLGDVAAVRDRISEACKWKDLAGQAGAAVAKTPSAGKQANQ